MNFYICYINGRLVNYIIHFGVNYNYADGIIDVHDECANEQRWRFSDRDFNLQTGNK
jgi:hypothetical protein